MTYKELQDEIILFRFTERRRPSVQRWIQQRYAWIWGQCDWPWRRVDPATLTVLAGDPHPVMPPDFDRVIHLFNAEGSELVQSYPDEFDQDYASGQIQLAQGNPEAFKVVARVLTLAPVPASDATLYFSYYRLLAHRNAVGDIIAGPMANDDDEPIWDRGHHYLLATGGMSTGLKMENDPTWQALEAEFQQAFELMREDLLPPDRTITTQYAADPL